MPGSGRGRTRSTSVAAPATCRSSCAGGSGRTGGWWAPTSPSRCWSSHAARREQGLGVEFGWADALDLPYGDAGFDAVTIGFGARNLADLDRGLTEMARVLRPGGRLVILEITRPTREPLASFYGLWFDRLVPMLGAVADSDAYSYLPESVRSFPEPRELAARIDRAGFDEIRWLLLAGGIIAIRSATRSE
jgi:demethylmenaquinone methyltransferase/2-methoxy-6-polyprenyl-1,4-benzoquinol methylase